MGTPCAVNLANLFMEEVEKELVDKWLKSGQLKSYRRFVDDINSLFRCSRSVVEQFFAELNELEPTINLTFEISDARVIMLDLEIYKGPRFRKTGRLDIKTYQKPMNRYSYLPACSYHSDAMKRAFIKGEAIRYVRSNSQLEAYLELLQSFKDRLEARGYAKRFIDQALADVHYHKRQAYLSEKEKSTDIPLLFHIEANPAIDQSQIRKALDEFTRKTNLDPEVPRCVSAERITICTSLPAKLQRKVLKARSDRGL